MAAEHPSERDVHHQIEDEKGFSALWRPPYHSHAAARQKALHEIIGPDARRDLAEWHELEALHVSFVRRCRLAGRRVNARRFLDQTLGKDQRLAAGFDAGGAV